MWASEKTVLNTRYSQEMLSLMDIDRDNVAVSRRTDQNDANSANVCTPIM